MKAVTFANIVIKANKRRISLLKRFSRNSGVVYTFEPSRKGINSQIRKENAMTALHSGVATTIPYNTAAPIIPKKCSVLILAAI